MAWFWGGMLWFFACCAMRFIVSTSSSREVPAPPPPAIIGAFALMDTFFDNGDRTVAPEESLPTRVDNANGTLVAARLALQFFAPIILYGTVTRTFPMIEPSLFQVWRGFLVQERSFFAILAIQVGIGAAATAMTLRASQVKVPERPGVFWEMMRSGLWLYLFSFPWGGPSFSLVSYLWVTNAYQQPSVIVVCVSMLVTLAQAVLGKILCELSYRERAIQV